MKFLEYVKDHQIRNKIVFFVSLIFLITAIIILMFSSGSLKRIISKDKEEDFIERIRVIIRALDKKNNELKMTGFVNRYKQFFQDRILEDLEQFYYSQDESIFPFIIDYKGKIILHKNYKKNSTELKKYNFIKKITKWKNGSLYTKINNERAWLIFREFKKWEWIVIYSLKESEKFQAVNLHMAGLLIVLINSLIIIIIVLWISMNFILRSLFKVIGYVKDVKLEGDLTKRIIVDSKDEIGQLQSGINAMINKIHQLQIDAVKNAEIEKEMEIARNIQTTLLPEEKEFHHDQFDISAYMITAERVSGDYYDVLKNSDGKIMISIGDVSGHGLKSGMIMMMAQNIVQTLTSCFPNLSLTRIMEYTNHMLYLNLKERLKTGHYMTMCLLSQVTEGKFTFVGAHEDILIYRSKDHSVEKINTSGMWLGIIPNIKKQIEQGQGEFNLEVNDICFLYTDGVTELIDKNRKVYGIERLIEFLKNNGSKNVKDIAKKLIVELNQFMNEQIDDISFLLLKRLN